MTAARDFRATRVVLLAIMRFMSGVITRMTPSGSSSTRRVTRVPCASGSQMITAAYAPVQAQMEERR